MNGPTMSPIGLKNRPRIKPIVDPQIPYLEPPNFLVPIMGIT